MLILTRDPLADRIGSVVVAGITRTRRHVVSEFVLTPERDGVPKECVVTFDNIHTIPATGFGVESHRSHLREWLRRVEHSTMRWGAEASRVRFLP